MYYYCILFIASTIYEAVLVLSTFQEAQTSETTPSSSSDILGPFFGPGAQTSASFTLGSSSSSGPSTAAAPEAAPGSLGNTISTVLNQFFG